LGIWTPDSDEMKTMRPQPRVSIPAIAARARRAPESTFTVKKRSQSSSSIAKKSFGSKMPALLTRISGAGTAAMSAAHPASVATSAATPSAVAPGTSARNAATAAATLSCLRPLITTRAPAAARPRAMAWPMPAVEPVTSAVLPLKSIFIVAPLQTGIPAPA
jgi:hypothetical protein